MWIATVYTVHVTMIPRGSACVFIRHVVKTSIHNYFVITRRRVVVLNSVFTVYNV